MRSKEDAHDYRYFPDPDLLPLVLEDDFLAECRASLPELPDAKRKRYVEVLGLTPYNARELTAEVETFGTPSAPLSIDDKGLIFGCEKRLCAIGTSGNTPKLLNGALLDGVKESATITINKVRYAVTSIDKKLVLIKL